VYTVGMMRVQEVLGIVAVGLLFLGAAWASNVYSDELVRFLDVGVLGMVVYVGLGFFATVVAPVTTLPLVPVAVALWGPLLTALLSVAGWFAGSLVAFWIARRWGRPIVARVVSLEKVAEFERVLGVRHQFLTILLLRIAVPADVLSYALGLFSSVGWRTYALATLLGIMPFAFLFAYVSEAHWSMQVTVFGIVVVLLVFAYRFVRS
jgi:uncharacterized membrane protein YdjX (TVP38/TMEM64 family)